MLTEFHFDHEFFLSEALNKSHSVNGAILEHWERYGCLKIPFNQISDYKEALTLVPIKQRPRWSTAFVHFTKCDLPFYKTCAEIENELEMFQYKKTNGIMTTLANEDNFKRILPTLEYRSSQDEMEIVHLDHIDESKNFSGSKMASHISIKSTESLDDMWKTRFKKVIEHSKRITIVDRYLFKNIYENNSKSLDELIKRIKKLNKKISISLYSDGGDRYSDIEIFFNTYLRDNWSNGLHLNNNFSFFELNSCSDESFKKHCHDRYIAFDNFVYEIGIGVEIFKSTDRRNSTFSIKRKEDSGFNDAYKSLSTKRLWSHRESNS